MVSDPNDGTTGMHFVTDCFSLVGRLDNETSDRRCGTGLKWLNGDRLRFKLPEICQQHHPARQYIVGMKELTSKTPKKKQIRR